MLRATRIVIEGPDRVGKHTQTLMLADALENEGFTVKLVEVPVASPATYRLIYWMLRRGYAKTWPNLFQTVHFINKLAFQVFKLPWLSLSNSFILFDRWALSALVYGDAGGANAWYSRLMYSVLVKPDATFVLHGRPLNATATDTFESDDDLQSKVRHGYVAWALRGAALSNVVLVNAESTRDSVHAHIMRKLQGWNLL